MAIRINTRLPAGAFITYAMVDIAFATCRLPMIEDIPKGTRKARQGANDDLDEVQGVWCGQGWSRRRWRFPRLPFSPAAAADKWDLYVYNAVSTVSAVKGMNIVIEQIEKETGGDLTIRLHLGGSLPINTTTITQAVSDDVVQMGDDGYFLGNIPIGGVLRLPMLIRSPEEYQKAAAIMAPYLEKAFEKKGVLVLGQYIYPYQVAFSSKKLTSLADIKGQKIRVTSPEQGEFIKRLGGVPVTLGAPEVPSALDRSVVDGVLTASSGGGNIWKDLLKFNYRLGINYFNSVVIVNKERFGKLKPEVQAKSSQDRRGQHALDHQGDGG